MEELYTEDEEEQTIQFAVDNAPPVPEGQRCESEYHIEVCEDSFLCRRAITCEACGAVFDPLDDDALDYADDCPKCGSVRSLMDKGYIWMEEEPLATIPIFEIDKEHNKVCVTFFCELCCEGNDYSLGEYIADEGGWPREDGSLVMPSRCEEL